MGNEILLVSEVDVRHLLTMEDALKAVEEALKEKGLHRVQMPPKTYIYFKDYDGDFRTMPSYIQKMDVAGVKVVNVHPHNPKTCSLPVVMATILLIDPKTGAPLSILGGTTITAMRTGAIGGVATKYLGRKDSQILALVGAGAQARTQLLAISKVLNLKQVRVYDKLAQNTSQFIKETASYYPFDIIASPNIEQCIKGADVVTTITPVTRPIVENAWILPGTHINAIGADAPGKEELDPKILQRAKIVVDDFEQATHSGEINVPLTKGILTREDIYGELCEVVVGKKAGRKTTEEITVFDSTGLSLQDLATAHIVYERAKKHKLGKWITL